MILKDVLFILFIIFIVYVHFPDILCSYRVHNLKKSSLTPFVNNYKNLKKCTNDKVVLSLTTTPCKIKDITPMFNSLLDQTVKVNQISLNIPEKCNDETYDIPAEYKDICNIYTTGKDYGIGTKYVPTLLRENECGTKIILLNDNIIYGKDFIETLLKESDNNPDKCIYVGNTFENADGILIKPEFITDIIHDKCDNKWLHDNLKSDKVKVNYSKNKKFL